jgi:glycosyltransferase involved in cell wall biosynthesis
MKRFLKKHVIDYDIVHSHSVFLWPGWIASSMAHKHHIAFVVAPRGMLVRELIERRGRIRKQMSIALFDRRAIEAADAVHFTSERERTDCEEIGIKANNAIVVPNGVELPTSSYSQNVANPTIGGEGYIIYLGRISWKKGIDRLIQAVATIPEIKLRVVGNDDENYQPKLEALAEELGVARRVEFYGEAAGDEKWDLLARAAVLVLPSLSENFGNVVLEAMAASTPVVVSEGVGLADTVERAGAGLVCNGSSEAISTAIRQILQNPVRARQMSNAGRKTVVDEFSWPVVAKRMEREYQKILDKRRKPEFL